MNIKRLSIPNRPDGGGHSGKEMYVTVNCWDFSIKPKVVYMYRAEALAVYRGDEGNRTEIRMSAKDKRALIKQVADR